MDSKIEQWKKQFGEVWEVTVPCQTINDEGVARAFLKRPDRTAISRAMALQESDPLLGKAILLDSAWLDGDECIKSDDVLFLAVATKLSRIIEIPVASLKKK